MVTRPETTLMKVTPKQAEQWLATGDGMQRRLNKQRVVGLAGAMSRGEWEITHQGIAISSDGTLMDGQHRLAAILLYAKPVQMVVTTGLPRRVFDVIDVGAVRTGGDLFHIQGLPSGNQLAAIAKAVILYDEFPARVWTGASAQNFVSKRRLMDAVTADQERYLAAVRDAHRVRNNLPANPTALGTLIYLATRAGQDDALDGFLLGLETGADLRRGDVRLTFRNQMLGEAGRHRPMQYVLALLIKAWNAYLEGRELHVLKWITAEAMPRLETP